MIRTLILVVGLLFGLTSCDDPTSKVVGWLESATGLMIKQTNQLAKQNEQLDKQNERLDKIGTLMGQNEDRWSAIGKAQRELEYGRRDLDADREREAEHAQSKLISATFDVRAAAAVLAQAVLFVREQGDVEGVYYQIARIHSYLWRETGASGSAYKKAFRRVILGETSADFYRNWQLLKPMAMLFVSSEDIAVLEKVQFLFKDRLGNLDWEEVSEAFGEWFKYCRYGDQHFDKCQFLDKKFAAVFYNDGKQMSEDAMHLIGVVARIGTEKTDGPAKAKVAKRILAEIFEAKNKK
mgnify:CR=1 FL=1